MLISTKKYVVNGESTGFEIHSLAMSTETDSTSLERENCFFNDSECPA